MTLAELISAVKTALHDGEYSRWSDAVITSILNQGLVKVARGIMLPGRYQLTPPLPELYYEGSITTVSGNGICSLPDDFQRDLIGVINANGDVVRIEKSFKKFASQYLGEERSGSPYVCVRNGSRLLFRDIPEVSETMQVHYYRVPELMSNGTDEPEGIPEELQEKLLKSFACKEIFTLIEDGVDGQKINTAYWSNEFNEGLVQLEILIGFDDDPVYIEDCTERAWQNISE